MKNIPFYLIMLVIIGIMMSKGIAYGWNIEFISQYNKCIDVDNINDYLNEIILTIN